MSPVTRHQIWKYKKKCKKKGELLIFLIECCAIILKTGELLENESGQNEEELSELRNLGKYIVQYLTSLVPPNMNISQTQLFECEDKLTPGILLIHILGMENKNFLDYDEVWYNVLDRINLGTLNLKSKLSALIYNYPFSINEIKNEQPYSEKTNIQNSGKTNTTNPVKPGLRIPV